jgi:Mce-associated membrane protein
MITPFRRRSAPRHREDPAASPPADAPETTVGDYGAPDQPSPGTVQELPAENASGETDSTEEAVVDGEEPTATDARPRRYLRAVVFLVLPLVGLGIAAGAGYLKYQATSMHEAQAAAADTIRAASDTTVKMLSYRPDTVERDLGAAQDLLTGNLRKDYTSLTHDVVIPGAKQKQISAVATVPAAASVSTTADHAVVLVFVNQTVIIGADPPANSTSSVRVTLQKQDDRWLVSSFDPI